MNFLQTMMGSDKLHENLQNFDIEFSIQFGSHKIYQEDKGQASRTRLA